MRHLTPNEIMEIADGFVKSEKIDEVFEHIKVCSLCRNEVTLFKQINSTAHNFPMKKVSNTFTHNIMAKIIPQKKESLVKSFLLQRGYYLILLFTAIVVIYAFVNLKWETSLSTNDTNSTLNETITNYSDSIDSFTKEISGFFYNLSFLLFNTFGNMIFFGALTILILAFLDRLLYKKFFKLK